MHSADLTGCWWHSDSACVSHHFDSDWIPAPCSYLIKVTLVTCEKSVVQLNSTKHCRFSPGIPVSCCSNIGPMRGALDWLSWESSLGN